MSASRARASFTRRQLLAGAGALGLTGLVAACGGGSDSGGAGSSTSPSGQGAEPRPGGTLRFGFFSATANDSLDLPTAVNDFAIAIGRQLNVGLARVTPAGELVLLLAEEFDTSSPDEVVVRLRQGLEFHDGRSITADDVLASYRRMADPAEITSPLAFLGAIDMASSAVVDDRTVRFVLTRPDAFVLNGLAHGNGAIYPGGAFDADNPVGAGPFRLTRFTPGTSAEFERFENYPTPALLDGLVIQNFADPTAMTNALSGGSVDAVGRVPASQAATLSSNVKALRADTGSWGGFVLDASKAPFDDPRVRRAFKLLVDRPRMVEQLLSDAGSVANDLTSPADPAYLGDDLDQREQDVDQARSLLSDAGAEGLELDIAIGGLMPNLEVVLAEQLRAGGVTLNTTQVDSTTYFSSHYAQDPIYTTLWPALALSAQIASSLAPDAFYAEGNWQNDEFKSLWTDAQADLDESTRTDKLQDMQRILYEEGPYLIWGFQEEIDAMANNVQGGEPDASGFPFSGYDFSRVWFS